MSTPRSDESETRDARDVTIPCTLSLGSIGVSFEQLQRLHPGATIEFETPEMLQLTLCIGAAPFAEATGTFKEGKAEIVIQKLVGYPESFEGQPELCKKLFSNVVD